MALRQQPVSIYICGTSWPVGGIIPRPLSQTSNKQNPTGFMQSLRVLENPKSQKAINIHMPRHRYAQQQQPASVYICGTSWPGATTILPDPFFQIGNKQNHTGSVQSLRMLERPGVWQAFSRKSLKTPNHRKRRQARWLQKTQITENVGSSTCPGANGSVAASNLCLKKLYICDYQLTRRYYSTLRPLFQISNTKNPTGFVQTLRVLESRAKQTTFSGL